MATGGTPALEPPAPGREYAITSNEIFDLPTLPQRLLIIGAGYIAVEFASIFARLGTKVAIATRGENVLRGFDEDMRCGVRDALIHAGVEIHFNQLLTGIEKTAHGLRAHSTEGPHLDVDQLMIATGRRPNTAGLGLENVGVDLDRVGAIKVDAFSQTSIPSIYAVGDVTDRLALTPIAIREGHAFADTVFGGKPTAVVHVNVPTAVFTTPEVGTVGLSESEARAIYDIVDIYEASFRPLKASLSGRGEKVRMKIVVDGATRRRAWRAYPWRGRRRNGAASRHRHQARREEGRFRRYGRRASDLGGGTRHHARAHGAPCARDSRPRGSRCSSGGGEGLSVMLAKIFSAVLGKFAILLLILLLIGALPIWRHSARWGLIPAAIIAMLTVVVYIFARIGRI